MKGTARDESLQVLLWTEVVRMRLYDRPADVAEPEQPVNEPSEETDR